MSLGRDISANPGGGKENQNIQINSKIYDVVFRDATHLHVELDSFHEFLHLRDLINFPVCFVNVEPTLANFAQTRADGRSKRRDPTVSKEERHLVSKNKVKYMT